MEATIKSIPGLVNWSNVVLEATNMVDFKREIKHPEHRIIIFKENSCRDYIIESFE
jgi:hypothetical protein